MVIIPFVVRHSWHTSATFIEVAMSYVSLLTSKFITTTDTTITFIKNITITYFGLASRPVFITQPITVCQRNYFFCFSNNHMFGSLHCKYAVRVTLQSLWQAPLGHIMNHGLSQWSELISQYDIPMCCTEYMKFKQLHLVCLITFPYPIL